MHRGVMYSIKMCIRDRAWQRWWAVEDAPTGEWLVCWPGRIVVLEPDFELTQTQMTLAAEKLAP